MDSDARPWGSVPEKPIQRGPSGTCSDGAICGAENLLHLGRLDLPIFFISLNNTEGVDPEIRNTKRTSDSHCILKGFWHFIERNFVLATVKVTSRCNESLHVFEISPTVAQSNILVPGIVSSLYKSEARVLNCTDKYDSCRHAVNVPLLFPSRGAVVRRIAQMYPFIDKLELLWASAVGKNR